MHEIDINIKRIILEVLQQRSTVINKMRSNARIALIMVVRARFK